MHPVAIALIVTIQVFIWVLLNMTKERSLQGSFPLVDSLPLTVAASFLILDAQEVIADSLFIIRVHRTSPPKSAGLRRQK
jgi:hypothetical protein